MSTTSECTRVGPDMSEMVADAVRCDSETSRRIFRIPWVLSIWGFRRECGERATWAAVLPCCGLVTFCCDGHRNSYADLYTCGRCSANFPTNAGWNWQRL